MTQLNVDSALRAYAQMETRRKRGNELASRLRSFDPNALNDRDRQILQSLEGGAETPEIRDAARARIAELSGRPILTAETGALTQDQAERRNAYVAQQAAAAGNPNDRPYGTPTAPGTYGLSVAPETAARADQERAGLVTIAKRLLDAETMGRQDMLNPQGIAREALASEERNVRTKADSEVNAARARASGESAVANRELMGHIGGSVIQALASYLTGSQENASRAAIARGQNETDLKIAEMTNEAMRQETASDKDMISRAAAVTRSQGLVPDPITGQPMVGPNGAAIQSPEYISQHAALVNPIADLRKGATGSGMFTLVNPSLAESGAGQIRSILEDVASRDPNLARRLASEIMAEITSETDNGLAIKVPDEGFFTSLMEGGYKGAVNKRTNARSSLAALIQYLQQAGYVPQDQPPLALAR